MLERYGEVPEDHRPHEHVVDREAFLDDVAGQVLPGGRGAERDREHAPEAEADGDPHTGADSGRAERDLALLAAERQEVGDDERGERDDDRYPGPRGNVDGRTGDVTR